MIPDTPQQVALISEQNQLQAFIKRADQAPWIAVDTEFQREHTYYPVLCLVQIATTEEIALIDTLAFAPDQLQSLADLMANTQVLKIFHAADQDVEVLTQTLGATPAPVLDTQVAAALCGQGHQIGYAAMVKAYTGIELPKTETRADWTRRPLSDKALTYAADDVRWLAGVYPLLVEELEQQGRLTWAQADSADIAQAAATPEQLDKVWQRIKHWYELDNVGQQILAVIARWREQQAIAADKPRRWILPDASVLALAEHKPADMPALQALGCVPNKTCKRHGQALLECIAQGLRQPAEPLALQPERLTGEQKQLLKKIKQRVNRCAEQQNVPGPMLARRKELEKLVRGGRKVRVLTGWRLELIGEELLQALT